MDISLSDKQITPREVNEHYKVVEGAIFLYYSAANPDFQTRFQYYSNDDILEERSASLAEAGEASTMMMLAAIEARFRVDYHCRHSKKEDDGLSRELRDLNKKRGKKAFISFGELLGIWKEHGDIEGSLADELCKLIDYRNWLAHGRYNMPKLDSKYNFQNVYSVVLQIEATVSLLRWQSDE